MAMYRLRPSKAIGSSISGGLCSIVRQVLGTIRANDLSQGGISVALASIACYTTCTSVLVIEAAIPVVVDTSVILSVVLNEPIKPALIRLTSGVDLVAPLSLHWEVGNALSDMFRRNRLTLEEGRQAFAAYQRVALRFLDVSLDEALVLAAQHNIYAYDAYFVVCARSQNSPLITLDNGLRTVAQRAGISVVEVNP